MALLTSFPYPDLRRAGLRTGAFFCAVALSGSALSLTTATTEFGQTIAGPARVVDGDTIDVGSLRVRLEGIDAPEISQTCQKASGQTWDCGLKAAAALRELTAAYDVMCDRTGIDKYGRALATCYAAGININETMVRTGWAWAFVRYSKAFVAVEAEARAAKLGVWQGQAQAPWDYRRQEWQVAEQSAPSGCAIKGNISAHGRIYHLPWDPWYEKVRVDEGRGERWFCSEADAKAAGWRPATHY